MRKTFTTLAPAVAAGMLACGLTATFTGSAAAAVPPQVSAGHSAAAADRSEAMDSSKHPINSIERRAHTDVGGNNTAPQNAQFGADGSTSTRVTLTPGTMRNLRAARISLKATGKASESSRGGTAVLRFPHTRTHEADRTIRYDGAIRFNRGARDLTLSHFRFKAKTKTPTISAMIQHDARATLFTVRPNKAGTTQRIYLNRLGAGQLDTVFGTRRFHAGQKFADVTMPHHFVGDTDWTETIGVTITNHSRMTMELISAHAASDHDQVTQLPASVLYPGDSTFVNYGSTGSRGGQLNITYQVLNTTNQLTAQYYDPLAFTNTPECESPSWEQANCSMTHGWKATGTWDFYDTNTSPITDLGNAGPHTFWLPKIGAMTKVIQVNALSTDNGGTVSLFTDSHYANNLWKFIPFGTDGYGEIVNVNSNKCLEYNGTNGSIDQWECGGSDNHLWKGVWNQGDNATSFKNKYKQQYLSLPDQPEHTADGTQFVWSPVLDHRDSFIVDGLPAA